MFTYITSIAISELETVIPVMENTAAASKAESAASGPEQDVLRELHWWQKAVVYQVLVPSFKDTNHDGHGDLLGIAENLDYIAELGANIVWLSPIFESPMTDMGWSSYSHHLRR